jgi:hypothetical protein
MIGPSYYWSLVQRQREEEERRRRERDKQFGFLMPKRWGGEDVDPEISRQARAQALIAFGIPLLKAGGTGDFGGALAEGAAGFTGTMSDVLDHYQQQKKAEAELERTHARQDAQDAREEAFQQARMDDIKTDNERQAEVNKLKADQESTRRKYHEQLLRDLDPDKRKLLEPFVGGEQFDTAWLQIMKPEDKGSHASEVRLNLALEAAARAQENSNYNRQRDEKQDVQQAQNKWDAEFNKQKDDFERAFMAARNNGVGKIDHTSPEAALKGPKPPPSEAELLELVKRAELMAKQAVEQRLGPRPAGNSASILPPSAHGDRVLTYDPVTGTFK